MSERSGHALGRPQSEVGKGRWLSRLKDWFTASEPSAQALRKHKKIVYANSGITRNDPQAREKLHLPASTIPDNAIKPTSGPDPDDLARKRAQERRLKNPSRSDTLGSSGSWSQQSQSVSSSAVSSRQGPGPRSPFFPG